MRDVDAVVIGAGNAGLTAAAALQRGGARTLLLERHNVPGGCATSFRRGRFEFEVALHQLSGIGEPGQEFTLRRELEQLGVARKLEFVAEDELYRTVVPGALDVTVPADWAGAAEAIETAFPGTRPGVEKFFDLVREVAFWQVAAMRGTPGEEIDPVLFRHGLRSLQDVLDERFGDDDRVKSVLGAYWPYLGLPPSQLSFQDMALLLFAYVEFKPFHIRGGSQAMSTALLDSFLEAGGEVRFHTEVEAVLTRRGRAVGVRLAGGEEVTAVHVVSNASLPTTYAMVDEPSLLPPGLRRELGTRRIGISAFVVHMGLSATPAELGLTTSTSFVSADLDTDRAFASMRTLEPARALGVTSYDVAPIGFAPPGATHVSLLTLQYADVWQRLAPREYADAKFAYAQTLLDRMEVLTPGVRDAIEEADVGSPLTMMRYLGHPGGAIYGYDQEVADGWLFRTGEGLFDGGGEPSIAGLHVAGAWAGMGGFQPTLQAGARTARRVLSAA